MKVDYYVKNYTSGRRIILKDVLIKVGEFFAEAVKWNRKKMNEEFQDVLHFLQVWVYWRLGLNCELWKITEKSVDKFIKRKEVWRKIYEFVGLDKNISNYAGNYLKVEKVIKQLEKFGISKEKGEEAHRIIVLLRRK